MNQRFLRCVVAIALFTGVGTAQAHIGEAASGFMSGLTHPVFGLDHFLAMFSVGVLSAQLGGRAIYTVPAIFVGAMVAGGMVGVMQVGLPHTEQGIALSVIVLGVAIAVVRHGGRTLPVMVGATFFGFLHGYAHGMEMPLADDPVYYAAGFVISTAAIHILGVGVGHLLTARSELATLLRHLGSAMAGVGFMILVNGWVPLAG